MSTLIFIGLLGIFSYHCVSIYKEFRGSSAILREIIGLSGNVGRTIYYISLVWSFWHFPWWGPIIVFISSILLGGISAIFFQRNIIGSLLSPVLVIVLSVLSIIGLL